MDPLILLVTLATRIGESALDIRRVLNTISHAPAEIVRLKDVISHLHSIADHIKSTIDQRRNTHDQDNFCSEKILDALAKCQEKLESIKNTVQRATQAKTESTLVSRSWANFRITCKKEEIEEFEKQLGRAIDILNMTLLLDLIHSKSAIHSAVKKIAHQQQLVCTDVTNLQHNVSDLLKPQRLPVIPIVGSPASSKPLVYKTWSYSKGFTVQYQELRGRKERCTLILQAKILGSKKIIAQLSWPSAHSTISWNLAVRNLVPDDAAIIKACSLGDSGCVRDLLASRSATPNDITASNTTPLGVAIRAGSEEIVRLLLREGADPNLPSGDFNAPTQIAVYLEKPNIARMLVQHGADLDYTSTGWSILHYFFKTGKFTTNAEYFSIFEDYVVFDDIKDAAGWTSLHRCAAFGTAQDVQGMERLGAQACVDRYTTTTGLNPLHIAAGMNNANTLGAFISLYISRPSISSSLQPSVDILDAVDFDGWTPLHHAIFYQAKETTKWLLRNGASPFCKTYQTATWFPKGHENEGLETCDLAKLQGKEFLQYYIETLTEIGFDVTTDGEDFYWPCDDALVPD